MRWLDGIGKVFILAAAAVVILWLLLDKCNKPSGISEKVHKDAIIRALDTAHRQWQLKEDSLKGASEQISGRVDSLKKEKIKSDHNLQVFINRSEWLAAEVRRARAAGDTILLMERCDSLAGIVQGLNFSLVHHKWVIDSLIVVQDELAATHQNRAEESTKLIRAMKDSVRILSLLYDDVHSEYRRALKKANKKYAIAVSAGYGIAPSTNFLPFVGVTFSRTLIRF